MITPGDPQTSSVTILGRANEFSDVAKSNAVTSVLGAQAWSAASHAALVECFLG